ncbi:type VI secretion system protein TssA [Geomonas terrae]|uniref:Type VI secretion system protein TssA n=1 Tax=Geomonas terrae TaxID=2562681 RepID=A0A4V3NZE3_9BACT|nr:type VI secretion system protein TssA [Geomonas terrae]TGU71372.1 type VI secretion system protein TssA [Geomonas terrae]
MTQGIVIDELLLPIPGTDPAGTDLRYTTCYEEIMEARRCEDAISMGDWRHSVKTANWEKAVALTVSALSTRSKDLQIAVWLAEALTVLHGFRGLEQGVRLVAGLVERFWEGIYPQPEGGDLEYRAAPFQFLNEKVALHVRLIPLTDPEVTHGYSWLKWQQSRQVGSEAETKNRYGEIDEEKKNRREALLAEDAVSAEAFDAAAEQSKGRFARETRAQLSGCQESLELLVALLEEKFSGAAPSLSDLIGVIDACSALLDRVYGGVPAAHADPLAPVLDSAVHREQSAAGGTAHAPVAAVSEVITAAPAADALWDEALAMLAAGRFQEALAMLLYAANAAGSVRDRNRMRLKMGLLCLEAGRPDLARPIVEELHGIIEELHLERWESPLWIAEVLETYYRCLIAGGPLERDLELAQLLLRRICSFDVTKAMQYRI